MDSLPKALASPTEIELQGQRYIISPMTIGDWADFQNFILQQKIDRGLLALKRAFGNAIPPDAINTVLSKGVSEEETSKAAESIDSAFFLLWRSLVKTNPRITLEQARELVTIENLPIITAALGGNEPDEEPEGKKAEASN